MGGELSEKVGMAYSLFMLAESGVDDAHVEPDLGSLGNRLERLQRPVKLIVVVEFEGLDPCRDFLLPSCKSPETIPSMTDRSVGSPYLF